MGVGNVGGVSSSQGGATTWRPGWYPDPAGRFDYRYHDGEQWTTSVSVDGRWLVDPSPAGGEERPPGNGIAAAALVCGMVAMALGWLPVVFVGGAVLALAALVLGAVGLGRSRRVGAGRGFAVGGLITGVGGLLASAAGFVLTAGSFGIIGDGEPGPHVARIEQCAVADGVATIAGTITNTGEDDAGYVVSIEVRRPGKAAAYATLRLPVRDVQPGEAAPFTFSTEVRPLAIECEITDVASDRAVAPWLD
jgi:hypothetical protein